MAMVSAGEEDWPNLTARLVQRIAELESRLFESEFDDSPVEADWWLEYPLKGLVCAMIGDRFARHTLPACEVHYQRYQYHCVINSVS
jgi:hypothetical protein